MIVLAYDHRGYKLMQGIKEYLNKLKLEYIEFASTEYTASDNYAKFAKDATKYLAKNPEAKGIFSCGTGIGIAIAANRSKGIRAGICADPKTAFLARNDDDINVLVLAGNTIKLAKAKKLINIFLNTAFEGGRHIARLELLDK